MLIKGVIRNGITHILRNRLVSFLSLGVIAFSLLIFGIFDFVNHQLDAYVARFSNNIEAIFYLRDQTEPKEIQMLAERLKSNLLVKDVTFLSQDQARRDFTTQYPDMGFILSEFEGSPFPSSLQVTFHPLSDAERGKINALIDDIDKLTVVESKQVNLEWADKLSSINRFIRAIGWFLSTILIVISVFIIFNIIKINIVYRKDEIALFRLIGASDGYIRFPFIIEGAILGFLGSVMACIMLVALLKIFPLTASMVFEVVRTMINFGDIPPLLFLKLVVMGTLIGLFSSLLALGRFLKN